MKRKLVSIILTLMLVVTVVSGCSDNSYENYLRAVEKTDAQTKYSGDFTISMKADINIEGLTKEELKSVNLYNNLEVSNSYKSDKELGLIESNLYINFGGLGFDIKYYDDSVKAFLKMPIVEKYVYMDDLSALDSGMDIETPNMDYANFSDLISEESKDEIAKLWKDAIDQDNIVKGKESLIETKEGEVKATQYTIKYEDKMFKELILKSMLILYKDEKFKDAGLINLSNYESRTSGEFDAELLREEFIDILVIENFEINAYIDIDGYIVKEDMDLVITSNTKGMNALEKLSVNYTSKMSNFGKDQNIIIPAKEDLEFMSREEMENGLPSLFEDVFSR
ncbi:MAG: hypothetical protein WBA54_10565 [Acidaminobacteraceae bacterium]